MDRAEISGYRWDDAELTGAPDYLMPALLEEMSNLHELCAKRGGEGVRIGLW